MEGGKRYAATRIFLNEELRELQKAQEKRCGDWPYDEEFCTSLEKERTDEKKKREDAGEEVACRRLKNDGEEVMCYF